MITAAEQPVVLKVERSDGAFFVAGTGTDWKIPADGLKGWNSLDYTVSTSPNVHVDGAAIVSKRVEAKDRSAEARYVGSNPASARAGAIAFFNPKYTFKAHLTYMGRTRWCEGEQLAFDAGTGRVYDMPVLKWTMLCPDPYMRDEDGNDEAFGDSVPYFGFPFVSFMRKAVTNGSNRPVGSTPSRKVYDGVNTIYNGGDVPSRYKIRIEAEGELKNPKVEKDGKKIQLVTTLQAGDVALVDFEGEETTVTINGEDALSVVSRDSSLLGMEMQVGANVFTFSVTNVENRSLAKVQILYHKKYLGV